MKATIGVISFLWLFLDSLIAYYPIRLSSFYLTQRLRVSSLLSLKSDFSLEQGALLPLTDDGGVKKQVIIVGQGKVIEAGDILAIRYEALLDQGAYSEYPFAASEKETCIVRDGSLITGWDIGQDQLVLIYVVSF
jgi:hypothetical protein